MTRDPLNFCEPCRAGPWLGWKRCRACNSAKGRHYYERNRAWVLHRTAEYGRENPAVRREAHSRWLERNPTGAYLANRKWAEANPEVYRAMHLRSKAKERYGDMSEAWFELRSLEWVLYRKKSA